MTTVNLDWVSAEHFEDDGVFPNSRFPALIYRAALAPDEANAAGMEAMLRANGWVPQWRSGIYPFHHYHSNAHEVLCVASGRGRIMLGGPRGRTYDICQGDVVLLPAGLAHRKLSATGDFLVVGAYPTEKRWDLLRGEPGERPRADLNIAAVPVPPLDPVAGLDGPMLTKWAAVLPAHMPHAARRRHGPRPHATH